MDCQQIDRILDGHELANLSQERREAFERHLAECRRCADAVLADNALRGDGISPPRPELLAETVAGLQVPDQPASSRPLPMRQGFVRRHPWPVGLAAATILTVGLALALMPRNEIDPEGAADAGTELVAADAAGTPAGSLRLETEPAEIAGLVAGRDYRRLPEPAPTTVDSGFIEVCEFFMWQCPHCFDFEPELDAWADSQSERVRLVRVPALFNGLARLHAQAYYTAELLGQGDRVRLPFYREIHERGNPLDSAAEIRAFFVGLGIDGSRFDQVFRSDAVLAELERAAELNRLYQVSATPSIGVNGRYLTSPAMVGAQESILDIVDALVASESRSRCPSADDSACPLP